MPESPMPESQIPSEKLTELEKRLAKKIEEEQAPQQDSQGLKENPEKTLDVEKYDIDQHLVHLYKRARRREVDGKEQWVINPVEWWSVSKAYNGTGYDEKTGTPKNLGDYMTAIVNGPEGWEVFNVLPNGIGLGAIIFRRTAMVGLPEPTLLATEAKVTPPQDEEVAAIEKETMAWANEGGAVEGADSE